MTTLLFSIISLLVGFTLGWLGAERYLALLEFNRHEFDDLFVKNPHPELFDDDGNLDKGEYMFVNFDLGYDPAAPLEEEEDGAIED